MKRDFCIYIIFRPTGVPCYVGKGSTNRWKRHARKSHNQHLDRIIAKAGGELPVVKIREGLTEPEAFEIERAFIKAIGDAQRGIPKGPCTDARREAARIGMLAHHANRRMAEQAAEGL